MLERSQKANRRRRCLKLLAQRRAEAQRKSQNDQEKDGKDGRGEGEKDGDGGNDGRGEHAQRSEDAHHRESKEPGQKDHRPASSRSAESEASS